MRAAIDIGSNSIRLATTDEVKKSVITKLADGIEKTGKLSASGVTATINALKEYAFLASGAEKITAFATEAVRRAADGEEFCARVKRECGLDVKIVPSVAEARMALFGATKKDGACTVCDLGGGSMEIICARDGVTPDYEKSLPFGVVVLKNKYNGDYARLSGDAPKLIEEYGPLPKHPLTVMGGSATTIAAGLMNLRYYDEKKVNGATVTLKELDGFLPMLMSNKLGVLRPVTAKRADTVAYGAIILLALCNRIGVDRFTVSDTGNLDAVLKGFEIN